MSRASWSALRHRDFAIYWVAVVTEAFALSMALVAIGWQVYSVRENPLDLGLIGLAEFLPLLLLALPAGQLADRVPRRRLLASMVILDIVVLARPARRHDRRCEQGLAVLRARVPLGVRQRYRELPQAERSRPRSFRGDSGERARPALGRVVQISVVVGPAAGGLLFALSAELV